MTTIPSAQGDVTVGDVLTTSRTYTVEEVREFHRLSDPGAEHADVSRLPYLLIVAPLTKLGGDLNYLSGHMVWTVSRPVAVTETVTAELEITKLTPAGNGTKIAFNARIRCGDEIVVSGQSRGIVLSA